MARPQQVQVVAVVVHQVVLVAQAEPTLAVLGIYMVEEVAEMTQREDRVEMALLVISVV